MALLAACKQDEAPTDGAIALSVTLDEVEVGSRAAQYADPYRGSVPTPAKPLDVKALFSLTSGTYTHAPAGETSLPCHTTIHYESAIPTYPEAWSGNVLKYPTTNEPVYCVGLYPKEGWTVSPDGKSASHALDGYTDIMFAEQIEGKWTSHFGAQLYKHKLAWLKINVVAVNNDAPVFWGDLKEIYIETPDGVTIELYNTSAGKAQFTYNTTTLLVPTYEGSLPLTTTIKDIGSVLCAPALSYKVHVKTEKEERVVDVPLTDLHGNPLTVADNAAGKQYAIELYFHPFSVIEALCTLQSWEYKDDNIYLE